MPETGSVAFEKPRPAASQRHVSARETRSQEVNWLYFIVAYFLDIPEVSHPWEMLFQDRRAVRVIVCDEDEIDAPEDILQGNFDPPVTRAETADAHPFSLSG